MFKIQQQLLEKSWFGKLPIEEEKRLAKEISDRLDDLLARVYLPFVAFDKEKIKSGLVEVKRKLEEMGV